MYETCLKVWGQLGQRCAGASRRDARPINAWRRRGQRDSQSRPEAEEEGKLYVLSCEFRKDKPHSWEVPFFLCNLHVSFMTWPLREMASHWSVATCHRFCEDFLLPRWRLRSCKISRPPFRTRALNFLHAMYMIRRKVKYIRLLKAIE